MYLKTALTATLLLVFLLGGLVVLRPLLPVPQAAAARVVDTIPIGVGGLQPISIAVDPTTGLAYAATVRSSSLTVFDPGLGVALASIELASQPRAVAVNPATQRVYVTESANAVTVIDATSHRIIERVVLGAAPDRSGMGNGLWGLAVNSVTNRVYVASQSADSLLVLDGMTNALLAEVPMRAPWGVAVNAVTNRVYVVARNDLVVVDAATNTVIDTVTVAEAPHIACLSGEAGLAVNPLTNRIYVGSICAGPGTVNLPFGPPSAFGPGIVVIDGATHAVRRTLLLPFEGGIGGLAVNPMLGHVYAKRGFLTVIDEESGSVLTTVPAEEDRPGGMRVFGNTNQVAVDTVAGRVLVARQRENAVAVVDAATHAVIAKVPIGRQPRALAVNPRTNTIYAASAETHSVLAIDASTGDVTAAWPVSRASAVAINPQTDRVYATTVSPGQLIVADGTTHGIVATVGIEMWSDRSCHHERRLAVTPRTQRIYVAATCHSGLFVVDESSHVVEYVELGVRPTALAVDSTTDRVYVTGRNAVAGHPVVTVLDGAGHRFEGGVALPAESWPIDVAVDPSGGRVFVLSGRADGSRIVTVVDPHALRVLTTVPVARSTRGLAVNPTASRLFLVAEEADAAQVIDTVNMQPVAMVPVGRKPVTVAVHPATGQVLVANEAGDSISILE